MAQGRFMVGAKILNLVGITQMDCLKHQEKNLVLQAGKDMEWWTPEAKS